MECTCHQLQTCTVLLCPLKHTLWTQSKCNISQTSFIAFKEFWVNTPHLSISRNSTTRCSWVTRWARKRSHSKSPQTLSSQRVSSYQVHRTSLPRVLTIGPMVRIPKWMNLNAKPQFCNNSPFTTDFPFLFLCFSSNKLRDDHIHCWFSVM